MSTAQDRSRQLHIGFLTALETRDRGYVGALLVTDRFGRPLEFQCTTPVRPNRTQELLYGPTLTPFIYSDLLGATLLNKVGVRPAFVITDRPEMLELRRQADVPVAVLRNAEESTDDDSSVTIGSSRFAVHEEFQSDVESIRKLTEVLSRQADLSEPLERVSEALAETMTTVSRRPRVA